MGVYQDGIMKDHINGRAVSSHIFEYTTQMCVDVDSHVRGAEKDVVPCQILFCLKENNAKKINSHRWFFNAFGPILNPNVCVLLDVGTKPTPLSLYHLWKQFDREPNCGGACGEIYAELGPWAGNLLNPLVAAQNFGKENKFQFPPFLCRSRWAELTIFFQTFTAFPTGLAYL